jgi:hypothetical protein
VLQDRPRSAPRCKAGRVCFIVHFGYKPVIDLCVAQAARLVQLKHRGARISGRSCRKVAASASWPLLLKTGAPNLSPLDLRGGDCAEPTIAPAASGARCRVERAPDVLNLIAMSRGFRRRRDAAVNRRTIDRSKGRSPSRRARRACIIGSDGSTTSFSRLTPLDCVCRRMDIDIHRQGDTEC